jgi:CHAT domain-containing protein/tetratricopeptide (TPR) repeat protein
LLQGAEAKRVQELEQSIAELRKKGHFAEAVKPARESLAIRSRLQGDDHWETAIARCKARSCARAADLPTGDRGDLAAALKQREQGENLCQNERYADAETMLRKSADAHYRVLGADDPEAGSIYNSLAVALNSQGKYAEAETQYNRALEILCRVLGNDHPETADCCNNMAINYDAMGNHALAERLHQQALSTRRHALGENHSDTAQSYNNLAGNLFARGKYAEAEPLFERALAIRSRILGEDHLLVALGYDNLSVNLNALGRYAEAERFCQRALAIRHRTLPENHTDLGVGYNNLAMNLSDQGKYAEAEPLLRAALAIWSHTAGEDHPSTAICHHNLAGNLRAQGRFSEAATLEAKALAIRRGKLGEQHPQTASSYISLAAIQTAQGKFADAEPLYRKAAEIFRQALGDLHPDAAKGYGNLALNLDDQGKYTEAEPLHRKTLKIRRDALGESHDFTAFAYGSLGLNLNAQGKYTEAETMTKAAVQSFEVARLLLSHSGLGRAELPTRRSPLALAAALLARGGRNREAWQAWEAGLARGLFDDLATRRHRPMTDDERRREEDLIGPFSQLDNQITAMTVNKPPTGDRLKRLQELQKQRIELQSRLIEFESELVRKYGTAAGGVSTLEQIQAQLPAEASLVGWLDLGMMTNSANSQGDHWGCVVRHSGPPRWVRIAGTTTSHAWNQSDEQRPGEVRRILNDVGESDWRELLAKLAEQRISPLDAALEAGSDLPKTRHLIILPSPALAGIPVEAMLEARPAGSTRYRVSYAPSATLFAWLQEHRPGQDHGTIQPRRLLALGDPVPPLYQGPSPPAPSTFAQIKGDALLRHARGALFERLPGSRREVQSIAGLFDQSQVYLGSDASKQTLAGLRSRGELTKFDVIHLATHGQIDDQLPMNSRLLLSQDRLPDPGATEGPAYDGILSAGEVMSTWKLNAELVTLSACKSGLGREAGGEGFIGFAQAFFLAGSRSLLVSLWEVDDRATSLLLTRFYQNWLGKRPGLSQPLSKAEALREAKEWLRGLSSADAEREVSQISRGEIRRSIPRPPAGHPFEHPHDWAGFILMGDPN